MPSKILYNLDYLNEIGSENPQFVNSVIRLFIKESVACLNNIKAALQQQNFQAVKLHAHKLKSSLKVLGVEQLAALMAEIETAALNENELAINKLLLKIEPALNDLTKSLKDYLAKY